MARDPRILLSMIVAPLIIFPVLGLLFRTSTESVQESLRTMSIGIANLDRDSFAQNLTDYLRSYGNVKLQNLTAPSVSEIAAMIPMVERLQMNGITIIMVEHRVRELFRLANRVMVMNFGEKIAEDPRRNVAAPPYGDDKIRLVAR